MKKYQKLGLIQLFLAIVLILQIQNSMAWSNSSYADNSSSYNYAYDYGTHDWIADAALSALLKHESTNWEWLSDRETIYLVGTEAPDNSGVSMTLDGKVIEGFGDTTWHHIYFNEDGTIYSNEDDSGLRAKSMGDLADANLEENKFDLAAFYLGAMTHYIADMAMYSHVARNDVEPYNVNFDEYHSKVEGYVNTRTNEYDDKEEFFKIGSLSIGSKTPYDAAKDLAWDTYKDPNGNNDAKWMHDNFFTGWEQSYIDRSTDTATHQEYYDRIEESINNAIEACMAAMNYIIGGSTSSSTEGSSLEELINEIPSFPLPVLISITTGSILGILIWILKKRS